MAPDRNLMRPLRPEESRRQRSLVGELFDLAERGVKRDPSEAALVDDARRTKNLTELAWFDQERELQKRQEEAGRRRKKVERGIQYVYLQQQRQRKVLARMRQFARLFTQAQLQDRLKEEHGERKSQTLFEWIENKIGNHENTRKMVRTGVNIRLAKNRATIGPRELKYALWAGQHRMDLIGLLEQHGWDHTVAEQHYQQQHGSRISLPTPSFNRFGRGAAQRPAA